jgi:hypothetical protein
VGVVGSGMDAELVLLAYGLAVALLAWASMSEGDE